MNMNYADYILNKVLSSRFIKKKLAHILIALTANFIKLQLINLLSFFFMCHPVVDFVLPIVITTALSVYIDHFYYILEPYQEHFYRLARYLIDNYSVENYMYCKRIVITIILGYCLIIVSLVEINNRVIQLYILQYIVCFFIMDAYEQKYIQNFYHKYRAQPRTVVHQKMPVSLIESYYVGGSHSTIPPQTPMDSGLSNLFVDR